MDIPKTNLAIVGGCRRVKPAGLQSDFSWNLAADCGPGWRDVCLDLCGFLRGFRVDFLRTHPVGRAGEALTKTHAKPTHKST